jgi:hypothetical protein
MPCRANLCGGEIVCSCSARTPRDLPTGPRFGFGGDGQILTRVFSRFRGVALNHRQGGANGKSRQDWARRLSISEAFGSRLTGLGYRT